MVKIKCPYCGSEDIYIPTEVRIHVCLHDKLIEDRIKVSCLTCNRIFNAWVEAELTNLKITY